MGTMRGFSIKIKGVAARVPGNADALVREVLLACTATVVLRTPVDTGRARGNWQAQAGSAAQGVTPVPGSPGAGATEALARAQAVAAAYRGGVPLHITNNLPYIVPLNNGHSTQAPAGFVQLAIQSAIRKVKKARILR